MKICVFEWESVCGKDISPESLSRFGEVFLYGKPAPEEVEKLVRSVIEERMDLEQFSECDITLADLTKIRHALVSAFTGAYHHRIAYPNIRYKRTESGTKGENV